MASLPSHAVAALGIGAFFYKPGIPKRVWVVGAICSVIPDLDVIGFQLASDTVTFGDTGDSPTHLFLPLFWRVPLCSWDFGAACRILADSRCGHISFLQLQVTVCWTP
jgi:hypothetical protein